MTILQTHVVLVFKQRKLGPVVNTIKIFCTQTKGTYAEYYPTKLDQEIVATLDVKGEAKIIDSKQNKIEP
jgi:hypothetical protein